MIPKDLFQKIRKIEITTSRIVTDVFAGQYHSIFKGQGIEFDEVKEYNIGDDIRTIDWNVTARTGKPHVKRYVEERELTVMIMVDVSSSCRYGTRHALKSRIAAEISAILALSAIRNNDKVGLIIFSDIIEKFIPPRKGTKHLLRIIREVLYFEPKGHSTDIVLALEYLSKVTTRKAITFLISDFISDRMLAGESVTPNEEHKKAFAIANKRHDLIAVTLNDPTEIKMPDCGLIAFEDAETGQMGIVDSTDASSRKQYRQMNENRLRQRARLFQSVGMDYIDIFTDVPYEHELVKFFLKRKGRR